MTSVCFTPFRLPRIRATLLNGCGNYVDSATSFVSTKGIIEVQVAKEYEDRQEFFVKNGDGEFCVTETSPPILKWINVTLKFCAVDPELVNILSAEPIVLDDDDSPSVNSVGYRTREGSAASSNFAFEGWTRLAGQNVCSGNTTQYGYFLLPWLVEGTISDTTFGNDSVTFDLTARTHNSSPWSTGPYNVIASEATATLGNPLPLLTAITSTDHMHMQMTKLGPPLDACGGQDITPSLTITPAALVATLTIPNASLLPVIITWGDASTTTVTSGATTPHTYAAPGTYAVTLKSKSISAPTYTGSVTVS